MRFDLLPCVASQYNTVLTPGEFNIHMHRHFWPLTQGHIQNLALLLRGGGLYLSNPVAEDFHLSDPTAIVFNVDLFHFSSLSCSSFKLLRKLWRGWMFGGLIKGQLQHSSTFKRHHSCHHKAPRRFLVALRKVRKWKIRVLNMTWCYSKLHLVLQSVC